MIFERLSPSAKECVSNFLSEKNIKEHDILFHERLDHDGSDKYGHKSDLWDLFIFYKTQDKSAATDFTVSFYHREDWHCKTSEKYTLWKNYSLKDFKFGKSPWYQKNIIICKNLGL
jgi:hypothetical protein